VQGETEKKKTLIMKGRKYFFMQFKKNVFLFFAGKSGAIN